MTTQRLSDLIIEHGPFTQHDAASLLTLRATQGRAGRELNTLRDELIELRERRTAWACISVDEGMLLGLATTADRAKRFAQNDVGDADALTWRPHRLGGGREITTTWDYEIRPYEVTP